jgi:hypothetical protein
MMSRHLSFLRYVAPSNIWVFEWNVQVLPLAFFMCLGLSHFDDIVLQYIVRAERHVNEHLATRLMDPRLSHPNRFDRRTHHCRDHLNQ